jgi:hypothetical protein
MLLFMIIGKKSKRVQPNAGDCDRLGRVVPMMILSRDGKRDLYRHFPIALTKASTPLQEHCANPIPEARPACAQNASSAKAVGLRGEFLMPLL